MPADDKLAFFIWYWQESASGIILEISINTFEKLINLIIKFIKMGLNVKPLSDRVVIEPVAAENKTASGIIIPETAKEKPQKGKVVAVGKGTKDHDMTVKEGDMVLYGKYAGTELKLEGTDYLIMREDDILAIV